MHSSLIQPTMQIYAAGNYYAQATEPAADLKQLTHETTGRAIRRISRFIQLALIGAGRCTQGQQLPANTGVYFASGRGDLDVTVDIMQQLYRDAQTPKPLAFVNTVSNASCFYVAQSLGLSSNSNYVCNQYFAFESALQLAALDVQHRQASSVLIGSVDVATTPLNEHRQRLRLPASTPLGEGSHWLWAGPSNTHRPRLGELLAIKCLASAEQLIEWLKSLPLAATDCAIAAGQSLSDAGLAVIQQATGICHSFAYRDGLDHYDSQSGVVIAAFLSVESETRTLLHINADPDGRYMALLIRR